MTRIIFPRPIQLLCAVLLAFAPAKKLAAQWLQTNGPAGYEVADLYSVSDDTTYAATGGGIYRTTDFAHSWKLIGFAGRSVTKVWAHGSIVLAGVVDSTIGQYVGCDIYRSSDKGASWDRVSTGLDNNVVYLWAFGLQDTSIYVSASLVNPLGFNVLQSVDGGLSWYGSAGTASWFTGFATVGTTLFASTSQGIYYRSSTLAPWARVSGIDHAMNATSIFYDGVTLYVGTDEGMYTSFDTGRSWKIASKSVVSPRLLAGFHRQGSAGMTILADDSINYFISKDSGATWQFVVQSKPLPHVSICGLQTTPNDGTFLLCTGDHIYSFPPPFQTITEQDSGIINRDAAALQIINGGLYAATQNGFDRTMDKGATWQHFATSTRPGVVNTIAHLGTLIFVGGAGLFRTSDDGATWDTLHGGFGGFSILTALAASDSRLYAGSNSLLTSGLFISKDSGATWKQTDSTIQGIIYSIYADDSLVVVLTSVGTYRSVDFGATWENGQPLAYYILSGQMLSGSGSIVLSSANGLSRSNDGGLTWESVNIAVPPSSVESVLLNGNIGLAGTTAGVYFSTDAGLNWHFGADGLSVSTPGIAYDTAFAYAGTFGSSVWKAPFSSLSVSNASIARSASALRIYPNPFRTSAQLEYSLPAEFQLTIDLYNELGQKVAELFRGFAGQGTHSIDIGRLQLRPGCYFASLRTGNTIQSVPIVALP